ncbi:MAG TPA: flagellar export chaperone FliS [Acidimicrobiales bacterium]|nr:flagellar export chaperone FliS [Acidimicrobiales bacterium]
MYARALRDRYVGNVIDTVSPGRLVVMLYDRLVQDLMVAEAALAARDLKSASDALLHAQEIVLELRSGLDVNAWSGGPGLAQLYVFIYDQLLAANVQKDAERVAQCRGLVEPMRDAWAEAARVLGHGD